MSIFYRQWYLAITEILWTLVRSPKLDMNIFYALWSLAITDFPEL